MGKGGIIIKIKLKIILMTLIVLVCATTAASACPATIDVKPYSCPNPINLKSHGVVTVAVDGEFLCRAFGVDSVEDLDFKVLGVYLQESCDGYYTDNRYSLDFDKDATRVVVENVLIEPCCTGEPVEDYTPDILIKIKDLNYNGKDLCKGEYYLYINYGVNCTTYYTAFDCIKLIQL